MPHSFVDAFEFPYLRWDLCESINHHKTVKPNEQSFHRTNGSDVVRGPLDPPSSILTVLWLKNWKCTALLRGQASSHYIHPVKSRSIDSVRNIDLISDLFGNNEFYTKHCFRFPSLNNFAVTEKQSVTP
jgi:hypothetical protein